MVKLVLEFANMKELKEFLGEDITVEPEPIEDPVEDPTEDPIEDPTEPSDPPADPEPDPQPDISECPYPIDVAFDVRNSHELMRVKVGQKIGLKVQFVPGWTWALNNAVNVQLKHSGSIGTAYWMVVECLNANTETTTDLNMVMSGNVGMRVDGLEFAVSN